MKRDATGHLIPRSVARERGIGRGSYVSAEAVREILTPLRNGPFAYLIPSLVQNSDFALSIGDAVGLCFGEIERCGGCGKRVVPGTKDGPAVLGSGSCRMTTHAFFKSRLRCVDHFEAAGDTGLSRWRGFVSGQSAADLARACTTFVPVCLLEHWKYARVHTGYGLDAARKAFWDERAHTEKERARTDEPDAEPGLGHRDRRRCLQDLRKGCDQDDEGGIKSGHAGNVAPARSLATALESTDDAVVHAARYFTSRYPDLPAEAYALYVAVPQAAARVFYDTSLGPGEAPTDVVDKDMQRVWL